MSFELIKPDININFIGRRHITFAVVALVMCICLGSIIFKGLEMGIDFAGGLGVQVRFSENVQPDQIRQAMEQANLPIPSIQTIGDASDNEFLINLQVSEEIESNIATQTSLSQQVTDSLFAFFGREKVDIRQVEMVGPRVGLDLRQKALSALFYSMLMILIYISGRFENKWGTSAAFVGALLGVIYLASLAGISMSYLIILAVIVTIILCYCFKFEFALGAILSLLHDVIFTVGVFSLMDKEITLSFVAAILTIVGYSLNDTIIIYDRIREHAQKSRKGDYAETINRSINQTLSRTVLTSGSTLIVILALYLFGGQVKDFALALLIGIGVGTLSSIFVSAPALLLWSNPKSLLPDDSGNQLQPKTV